MAFAEFCCRSGGSNMNGGGLASGAEPSTTPVYSATNGGWNSGTGIFTPTSGNPSATVTVGDFANVFVDGATTPVFVGRVTAVSSTTVTVSTTVKSGTAPTTAGTGISINVGGAWKGPNGAVAFPFGFLTQTLTDGTNTARVNFKNDATYAITAAMTHSTQGPITWQGYTTTFGDLGRAVLDGGTSGASYTLLQFSGAGVDHYVNDFIFDHNGATGGADGVSMSTDRNQANRCVFRNMLGAGAGGGYYIECEAYSNKTGFFNPGSLLTCISCIAHDNSGGSGGFYSQGSDFIMINCIADTNGSHGFNINNITGCIILIGCEAYNNTGAGLRKQGTTSVTMMVKNCNFIKNGVYGVDLSGSSFGNGGFLYNCGYGAGTQANGTAKVNGLGPAQEIGAVTYANDVTPWVDPANGDFRVSLAAAKGGASTGGRGVWTQVAGSYAGTVGYPDIGAAQHLDSGGGGGGGGLLVNPGLWGGMS